jgi:hypothetical protein
VTLAVTGNTIYGQVFRRHRMPVCEWLRLRWIGRQLDIRWLSGRRMAPTLCVFRVFSMAVMEMCCDACGDDEYYFRSDFRRQRMQVFQEHRFPLTRIRCDMRCLNGRGKTPTLFVLSAWLLWKSVVTLAVTGNTISCRVVRRPRTPVFECLRLPLTVSRWDIRWLSGRWKTPTLCVFSVFSVAVMDKCCDACGDGEYYFRSIVSAL